MKLEKENLIFIDKLIKIRVKVICNKSIHIQQGNLLCSSNINGYLMIQDDNFIHSYTMAKALEDFIFDEFITTFDGTYYYGEINARLLV